MRYIDDVDLETNDKGDFALTNGLADHFDDLKSVFGDIHHLNKGLFNQLYESRTALHLINAELLSDITRVNITTWARFLEGAKTSSDLADDIHRISFDGSFFQIVSPIATGKTTYVHYFLNNIVPRILPDDVTYIPLVLDIRKKSLTTTKLVDIMVKFISRGG